MTRGDNGPTEGVGKLAMLAGWRLVHPYNPRKKKKEPTNLHTLHTHTYTQLFTGVFGVGSPQPTRANFRQLRPGVALC